MKWLIQALKPHQFEHDYHTDQGEVGTFFAIAKRV